MEDGAWVGNLPWFNRCITEAVPATEQPAQRVSQALSKPAPPCAYFYVHHKPVPQQGAFSGLDVSLRCPKQLHHPRQECPMVTVFHPSKMSPGITPGRDTLVPSKRPSATAGANVNLRASVCGDTIHTYFPDIRGKILPRISIHEVEDKARSSNSLSLVRGGVLANLMLLGAKLSTERSQVRSQRKQSGFTVGGLVHG